MERQKIHAWQQLKPLIIGGLLTFGGLFASAAASGPVGVPPMLVFAACMTPMMVYADYVRSVPGIYVTLLGWLWISIAYLISGNRAWDRAVGIAAFAIAFFVSKGIYALMAQRNRRENVPGDGR